MDIDENDLDGVVRRERGVQGKSFDEPAGRDEHPDTRDLLDFERHALVVIGERVDECRELMEQEVGC